ncbi:MAG: ABC transporter ATP-binding protein [candidate division Zixibacteria bacterium]|nr:ABC transporter ATP-binding protein [candidate division Zixibacteria bacterium]
MSKVIEIADYTWKYINTKMPALKDVNLSIEEGSFVGIIGPNGSGKTTLAYSMDGLIPGQYNGIKKGTVGVFGKEVEEYGRGELQRLVGVVFSDPEAQFTAMTVEIELVFGMENLGLTIPEIRERLEWVTELTDLAHLLEKPPYEISGGQKQRVALAAVLAMMPKVLILDEPTSMLDPVSRMRIFDVLAKLKAEQNNTIIVIEHSLEQLIPLADRMILLVDGETVLDEETQTFFRHTELLLGKSVYPPGALRFFHELSQRDRYRGDYPLTVADASTLLEDLI